MNEIVDHMTPRHPLVVRVPASSANLGPGFDVLGMALTLRADMGIVDEQSLDSSSVRAEGRHPALVAFRAAGGSGDVWTRCPIPSGRGLGFSGAMRVGGVALGLAQRDGVAQAEMQVFIDERRQEILNLSADLEGHADNVAASLHGGVVACAQIEGNVVATPVPLARRFASDSHIVVWVPHEQTATAESRSSLATSIDRVDVVFNLARMAQLLLGFGSGDTRALSAGVADRMHQEHRLSRVPTSRAALDRMRHNGAVAGWLSGSGPTVACLVEESEVRRVETSLTEGELARSGRVMRLAIDVDGLQAAR